MPKIETPTHKTISRKEKFVYFCTSANYECDGEDGGNRMLPMHPLVSVEEGTYIARVKAPVDREGYQQEAEIKFDDPEALADMEAELDGQDVDAEAVEGTGDAEAPQDDHGDDEGEDGHDQDDDHHDDAPQPQANDGHHDEAQSGGEEQVGAAGEPLDMAMAWCIN